MNFASPTHLLNLLLECDGKVCTDTRNVIEGSLFFALKGIQFDGNTFAAQALEAGVKYVVVDDIAYYKNGKDYVLVENALTALQSLAMLYRKECIAHIPLVVVAGSNGKTTTKELMYSIISQKFNTFCTPHNLNNHIGVPLSILNINPKKEKAIIEIGANHLGEHRILCEITQPNIALITNCGKDHLEGYGGEQGVLQSANEIVEYALCNQVILLLNADDKPLSALDTGSRALYFGQSSPHTTHDYFVSGKLKSCSTFLEVEIDERLYTTQLFGAFQMYNVLASVAIAKLWGIGDIHIRKGLSSYRPTANRGQILIWNNNRVLLDAYNANPSSMETMIKEMDTNTSTNKILILGDMAELGIYSHAEHQHILSCIQGTLYKEVILVGKHFLKMQVQYPQFLFFENRIDAKMWIEKQDWNDALILVKGSRSMRLEEIFT